MTVKKSRKPTFTPEKAILLAVILILLVLLFNTCCRAGLCGEVGPARASVKVRCGVPGGFATGSGTAIDPHYVITCEHVTNSTPENGRFEVFLYHQNKWVEARLAAAQPGDGIDISLLYVSEEMDYVPLGDENLRISDVQYGIEGYGFAGTDTLYSRKGTLLGEREAKLDIRYGDSGGGLFEGNKFIGVIWGSANPEGGVNQMQQGSQPNEIRIYTNNVCNFTPLRTIGRALRNWCATGRLRPARPYFGITITQDKVQNGSGQFCPGGNCPQGTPGYNGNYDGGNMSPNGNNPYFPHPERDNEDGNDVTPGQPPIAGDPVKPSKPPTPQTEPEKSSPENGTEKQIADIQAKLDELAVKLDELANKPQDSKCEELAAKQQELEAKLEELVKNKPQTGVLPNGKFRIKVAPKKAAA